MLTHLAHHYSLCISGIKTRVINLKDNQTAYYIKRCGTVACIHFTSDGMIKLNAASGITKHLLLKIMTLRFPQKTNSVKHLFVHTSVHYSQRTISTKYYSNPFIRYSAILLISKIPICTISMCRRIFPQI